ncbi:hypothetical protein N9N67_04950 [Bacteriovoracaceae bacterium]|nr:hypothetical protein [Bacteriovoracaceae bacterium]
MGLNQKGNVTVLMGLLVAIVTGNILVINMRHENFLDVLNRTEAKFQLRDFDTYIKSLIYNKKICNDIFQGQAVNYYASLPPFGDGIYGIVFNSLSPLGSNVVMVNEFYDRNRTIRPVQIFLDFGTTDPETSTTFVNNGVLKIEVEFEGRNEVLEYPMVFDVSYVVGVQIQVSPFVSRADIATMLLGGPGQAGSCIGEITSGDPVNHTIRDLFCDISYPDRACMAYCKYLLRDEENRIAACL